MLLLGGPRATGAGNLIEDSIDGVLVTGGGAVNRDLLGAGIDEEEGALSV